MHQKGQATCFARISMIICSLPWSSGNIVNNSLFNVNYCFDLSNRDIWKTNVSSSLKILRESMSGRVVIADRTDS